MKRGFSPAATAAFVTTLVVLGLVGWSIGWLAAGTELANGEPTNSPSVSSSPSRIQSPPASRSASPSPSATVTPQRTDAFAMPNLVGRKFLEARQDAFQRKLGVTVRFNEPSNKPHGTVVSTKPEEKALVYPGLTIVLYVSGPPVKVSVPDVTGKTCDEGKDELIQKGLRIHSYPSGSNGRVVRTDPPAPTELVWDEQVKLYCAVP